MILTLVVLVWTFTIGFTVGLACKVGRPKYDDGLRPLLRLVERVLAPSEDRADEQLRRAIGCGEIQHFNYPRRTA